jgi:REP element-mobilizing transposase RayT
MTYDPKIHHRQSIRYKGYDYSSPGVYFTTICSQNKSCLFGSVVATPCNCSSSEVSKNIRTETGLCRICGNAEMRLNNAGIMVKDVWNKIPLFYKGFSIDNFVIMPNHIHGILIIEESQSAGGGQAQGPAPTLTVSDVIMRFKTLTTKMYIDGVKKHQWKPFEGRLWQRGFFEHIIRNEKELLKIRDYISFNPMKWESDNLYKQ